MSHPPQNMLDAALGDVLYQDMMINTPKSLPAYENTEDVGLVKFVDHLGKESQYTLTTSPEWRDSGLVAARMVYDNKDPVAIIVNNDFLRYATHTSGNGMSVCLGILAQAMGHILADHDPSDIAKLGRMPDTYPDAVKYPTLTVEERSYIIARGLRLRGCYVLEAKATSWALSVADIDVVGHYLANRAAFAPALVDRMEASNRLVRILSRLDYEDPVSMHNRIADKLQGAQPMQRWQTPKLELHLK